jgi:hypothetical protein
LANPSLSARFFAQAGDPQYSARRTGFSIRRFSETRTVEAADPGLEVGAAPAGA